MFLLEPRRSPLVSAQPVRADPRGPRDPLPHGGLGQVEVLHDLTDRAIPALAQLDDLSLKSRMTNVTFGTASRTRNSSLQDREHLRVVVS